MEYILCESFQNFISFRFKVWNIILFKEILSVDRKYLGNIRNGKNQNMFLKVIRIIVGQMDVFFKNFWFRFWFE